MSNILVDLATQDSPTPLPHEILTPAQQKQAIDAARTLARKAARNHEEMVEIARDQFKPSVDQGENLAVLTRREDMGDSHMMHVVSLAEEDDEGAVVKHHIEVVIDTALEWTGRGVAYRSKARTLIDDFLVEVQKERVVGALIT